MKVKVSTYNDNWPSLFKMEAEQIKKVFKDQLIHIYHIGSTSVPGLQAKPIIDMMPVLHHITEADRYTEEMERLGYEALGEYGLPGRRYFRKGAEKRTHHVHMYDRSSQSEITRHLAVRDYLRGNPEEAQAYGELKTTLAKMHPHDIEAYIDGKNEFVLNLERKAIAWLRDYE